MSLRPLAIALACVLTALPATAQSNLLANPGFENGLSGWTPFGNAYAEVVNPPQFVPLSGSGLASMFGNFSGGFDVTGIFQQFPAAPGEVYEIDANARHFSGDALQGVGAPNDNWVVAKIAFFDAGGAEIGAAETTILDGTYPTDTWHDAVAASGTAPAGTVNVQALILYLQPANAGGAAHIDDVSFERVFDLSLAQSAPSGDLDIVLTGGEPFAQVGRFISLDPANAALPGQGNFFGLHIAPSNLSLQINAALMGAPYFGGNLDASGASTVTVPGTLLGSLSGVPAYLLAVQLTSGNSLETTDVEAISLL